MSRPAPNPGRRAWRGAAIGTAATATIGLAAVGTGLESGRGVLLDAVLAMAAGWALIGALAGLTLVMGRVLGAIPVRLRAVAFAAVLIIGLFLAVPVSPGGPLLVVVFVMGGALVGAGVRTLLGRPEGRVPRAAAVAGLAIGVLGVLVPPLWLASGRGEPDFPAVTPQGSFEVTTLTYGSGDHPLRPGFGAEVDVVTPTVDGTALLDGWSGWRGALRTRYWGHGPDALPLNATVWMPEGVQEAPVVLVAHGNHSMEIPSDEGYGWLAEDLASRGYVVVVVDQNFLNLSWTRGFGLSDENDARAWLLLEHLRLWRSWQRDPASPLFGVVDLDHIALIGHSRGGEAVAHAAAFDRLARYPEDARIAFDAGFGIDAVVAIAPIDGQYEPGGRPTPLRDVSYLVIHGGRDGDVATFYGLRQYARTTFSGARSAVKAAVHLEDANHGQFNTVWGRRDFVGLPGWTLETESLMAGEAQRADARTAIVAVLDAALRGNSAGLPLRNGAADGRWTGATRVSTLYESSDDVLVAGFDEDVDPTTATLTGAQVSGVGLSAWREEPAALRHGDQQTNGVVLGWEATGPADGASYTVRLPAGVDLGDRPALLLDVAAPSGGAPDFSVEVTLDGARTRHTAVSEHGGVQPPPNVRRLKAPLPDVLPRVEPIATTVRIPLEVPTGGEVTAVRLLFDRDPQGLIRVDRIALGSLGPS